MEKRNYGSAKRKTTDKRNQESSETRKFEGALKPLMTEADNMESWSDGTTERQNTIRNSDTRKFMNPLKPLLSEEEKSKAQVLDLSYDFSCRIIRLYKYLNEGKLGKADRDIIDALGRQLVRSATSINANMNEAQHPQSDADFLSKASIALKEARESENWLSLLRDNGYLSVDQASSILYDCSRINKILITITSKVKNRLKEEPRSHGNKELRKDSVDS